MTRLGRGTLLLCLGIVIGRLVVSGGFGVFVQQHMRLPLGAAAVVLVVFGLYDAIVGTRDERDNPESLLRSVGPAVGWLLVLPVAVLLSVAPSALGAAAANRVESFTPNQVDGTRFAELDDSDGPVPMGVYDFVERALWAEDGDLEGVEVRLEGLVVNDPDTPDGFLLTRFLVSCCAADGIPIQVAVHGTGEPLEDDTWVIADVVWRAPEIPYAEQTDGWVVEADAISIEVVPNAPNDPYESPY